MTGAGLLAFLRSRLGLGLLGALALGLALWGAVRWFDGRLDQARAEGRAAADAEWQGAFNTAYFAAVDWRAAYQFKAAEAANLRRIAHEQALARNAADADGLRLQGPGAAAASRCRSLDRAGPGPAASGSSAAAAAPDAPASPVPAEDGPDQFAIVPWGWLTTRARDLDDLIDEVTTWRTWYPEQADILRRARLELPEPKLGKETEQ